MIRNMKKKRQFTEAEQETAERLRAVWSRKKKELNLNQEKLVRAIGISQGAFSQYLRGITPVGIAAGLNISRALGVDISEINPAWGGLGGESISPFESLPQVNWSEALTHTPPFELVQTDNSMISKTGGTRSFFCGDILEFNPVKGPPKLESYYLYRVDGYSVALFGQHYGLQDGFRIHFLNESRADIDVSNSKSGAAIAELSGIRAKISIDNL